MLSEEKENKAIRHNFLVEVFKFIWARKVYWIVPAILCLILFILLITVGTSPISPFIYTII